MAQVVAEHGCEPRCETCLKLLAAPGVQEELRKMGEKPDEDIA
jgi:hypothetical protein